MPSKKVLIVGGVAGGASCAARLRRLDEKAEIIIFERGEYVSYANCGLPYHISGVIDERDALLLLTPDEMMIKYNLDVRVLSEVTAVNRKDKTITVKKVDTGETYTEGYDKLVLSTGSSPVRPPIPGIDSKKIMTLWTVPDADKIKAAVSQDGIKKAVVVGGGFIGLEMAENLTKAGLEVTIVEMLNQVMPPLDYELAQLLHENLEENGVKLCLGDGVDSFAESGGGITISLKSGKTLNTDIVILAIGTSPNSALAKASQLAVNARGGVIVDDMLRTSDPDIYAVGDITEVEDFIDKSRTSIPLAGPANRQGRIAADNIAGLEERYGGSQGTSVAQVYDMTAASTGLNEKTLIKRGLTRGRDFESVTIVQNSHAGYYPGAEPMTLKLLFAPDGKKLFGAQIVGRGGVDKRIDTLATAIRLGGGVEDLKSLELAYAPPYSSAKDPVNMLGFVAGNLISGNVAFAPWDVVEKADENTVLLDVREEEELMAFSVPGAKNIPLGQLRKRHTELDKAKQIVVFCAIGVRAYNAARILMNNGFENVRVYPGGASFYRSTHYQNNTAPEPAAAFKDTGESIKSTGNDNIAGNAPAAAVKLDSPSVRLNCTGLQCPGPIMKVFEEMKKLEDGQVLEILASDPGFTKDAAAWCRRTGNTFISSGKRGAEYFAVMKKGTAEKAQTALAPENDKNGKTIIVFSGDLDKALASFIIANGAAAMGRRVTMFFTFWGLNLLRKGDKVRVEKSLIENMFGMMMPRGAGKLKLSKLNMGGMGTVMMRRVMKDKNINSLEDLMQKAMQSGIKLVACTMSMDVMGIRPEELIDGVELGGVGAYLGDAEESDVNLFI
jgi:NADPH-dependent 2,4-dienoyl-CoA reductase/sulfur reductase-like enzyme/peroxiredoxin family protein/rhodanese-related sulfurtransferase/TusA-related sulfurtransferase